MFLCLMCFSCPRLVWTMGRRVTASPGGRSCCIGTAGFTAGRQIAVKKLRDTADVRRCSTAPSENMIKYVNVL